MDTCCSCLGRSFWEGRCDWCIANPEILPLFDYQQLARSVQIEGEKALDEIVTNAAIELGYQAGKHVAELAKENL
jgi:hypothetical protein